MKTRVFEVLWTIPVIGALILGWVAVKPVVGDVYAIRGACPESCTGTSSSKVCSDDCTGNYTSCGSSEYGDVGSCEAAGGGCTGTKCPESCACFFDY